MSESRRLQNHFRREQEVKRQICALITTIFLVLLLVFLLGGFLSRAEEGTGSHTEVYKYFSSHEVQKGDNLNSIAASHMGEHYDSAEAYIKEVKHINGLENDKIHTGQYIIIPYYSTEFVDF